MKRFASVLIVSGLLIAGGCSSSGSAIRESGGPTTTASGSKIVAPDTLSDGSFPSVASPKRDGSLANVRVTLTTVAKVKFAPMALVVRPDHPTELFVADRTGKVRLATIDPTSHRLTFRPAPLLDLTSIVGTDGEKGLLGLAFDRSGDTLYLSYNLQNGDTRIDAAPVTDIGGRPRLGARRNLLKVDQGGTDIHKGGNIQLGPDGYLYIGLGDGGPEDDPELHAQNPHLLLGKILRIDPTRRSGGKAYAIPADNPHATDGRAAPEIWLTGLRNPWRFSFDAENHDLWIGDVGQYEWEEIDRLPAGSVSAGANLGWSGFEGTSVFKSGRVEGVTVPPIFEISHREGVCAITGGVVYRGSKIPALAGTYLYSDLCRTGVYGLRSTTPDDGIGHVTDERKLASTPAINQVISFGTDAAGEVYLLSLDGVIRRIDPAR